MDSPNPKRPAPHPAGKWIGLALVSVLLLVAWQVYKGSTFKKIVLPGNIEIDFAEKPVAPIALPPEVSRDYLIGRWRVEQVVGQVSGVSAVDYQADGAFTGSMSQFIDDVGRKVPVSGRWDFEKLSKDRFRLNVQFDNQSSWSRTFQIIDQDRIQNIDDNYISVRVK